MTKVSKNPLISIVVPVYNVEEYLDKCVDSIVNQTYKNIEIILVDDGSPDNCPKKCDEWSKKDKRIRVIHKKNGGLSDARNVGIESSKGKYITLVDSDDYIENDYVDFLYNLLLDNDADMSVCKHRVIYEKAGTLNCYTGNFYILDKVEALEMMLYGNDFDLTACEKLYKRELFNNVKYPKGRLFEDSATTYKLIDICDKISFKSEPKYNYFVRSNSITTNTFNHRKMDLITSTKEMADYIVGKYPNLKKAANRRVMYAYLSTLTQLCKADNYCDYQNELNEMMSYIKKNRKEVLKDRKIPKRDRIALQLTKFGFVTFKMCWNFYEKATKRR